MKNDELQKQVCVSKLVLDNQAERILLGTYKKQRSAQEISRTYQIPIVECYRKIREMKDVGLLVVAETVINEKGRKTEIYRANLKSALICYEDNKMKIIWKW